MKIRVPVNLFLCPAVVADCSRETSPVAGCRLDSRGEILFQRVDQSRRRRTGSSDCQGELILSALNFKRYLFCFLSAPLALVYRQPATQQCRRSCRNFKAQPSRILSYIFFIISSWMRFWCWQICLLTLQLFPRMYQPSLYCDYKLYPVDKTFS